MRVTIDVNKEEYTLEFKQGDTSNGSGIAWIGMLSPAENQRIEIKFYEQNGLVENLIYSKSISTPEPTLSERIQEALNIYRASYSSDIEQEEEPSTDAEPTPYDPTKIKVRRDFSSIREIFIMMDQDKSIDLNPEFQRYFVWDNTQKSQFIESLLLGLPIPLFYFAENNDLTFNVIDGLQRLTTIRQYMSNEFAIKGLKRLGTEYNGKYYKLDEAKGISSDKTLSAPMVRRIEGTQLVINIIEATSPPQVKFDIFQRINSGGKHLNNQEIRNCIAMPPVRKMLHEMVHNDLFRGVTGNSVSERRMDDQELALRFTGFWLTYHKKLDYTGNMKNFLDNLVVFLNKYTEKDLKQISKAFEIGLLNCAHLFGKYAFRKCLPEHLKPDARRQSINKSLFTTWMVVLCTKDVRSEIPETSFAHIQAEYLAPKGDFYQNVTNKTNDRLIIEQVFKTVESITQKHLNPMSLPV